MTPDEELDSFPDCRNRWALGIIAGQEITLVICGRCNGAGGDMSGLCTDCLGHGELPR